MDSERFVWEQMQEAPIEHEANKQSEEEYGGYEPQGSGYRQEYTNTNLHHYDNQTIGATPTDDIYGGFMHQYSTNLPPPSMMSMPQIQTQQPIAATDQRLQGTPFWICSFQYLLI